jgi:hypothetical protein
MSILAFSKQDRSYMNAFGDLKNMYDNNKINKIRAFTFVYVCGNDSILHRGDQKMAI